MIKDIYFSPNHKSKFIKKFSISWNEENEIIDLKKRQMNLINWTILLVYHFIGITFESPFKIEKTNLTQTLKSNLLAYKFINIFVINGLTMINKYYSKSKTAKTK